MSFNRVCTPPPPENPTSTSSVMCFLPILSLNPCCSPPMPTCAHKRESRSCCNVAATGSCGCIAECCGCAAPLNTMEHRVVTVLLGFEACGMDSRQTPMPELSPTSARSKRVSHLRCKRTPLFTLMDAYSRSLRMGVKWRGNRERSPETASE